MNSEEYVNQVNRLVDLQNTYLQIFLAILAMVLAFIIFVQWRLNDKQLEQLKEKTKQETIREIEKNLGVSSLTEFKSDIEKQIQSVEIEQQWLEANQLWYELTKLFNEDDIPLWNLTSLMDIYKSQFLKSINNFNYLVSRIESQISILHTEKKIDIHSRHIDKVIQKMDEFESTFNEKSEKLESFQNQISCYRNEEKS